MIRFFIVFTLLLGAIFSMGGCASSSETEEQKSSFGPEDYILDVMYLERQTPRRPASDNAQFFYKHCNQEDGRAHYSKTSYECTNP